MKRSQWDEAVVSNDDAEMDVVDSEEQEDRYDDDSDVKDEDNVVVANAQDAQDASEQQQQQQQSPFLDSFYGISSQHATERAHAAKVLLHHSLLGGPDVANVKDASYAMKRLMNGLCSGRAAARQGNASTLASFLKIAFALGMMRDIKNEKATDDEKVLSDRAFVCCRLRSATQPSETKGRRKGSEERDYQFGRLFGINGIVRSGILLPVGGDDGPVLHDTLEVTSGLIRDLAELYRYKKWIREPAAHAVCTLLNSFYALCPDNTDAQKVVEHVVEAVVVPEFLLKGDIDTRPANDPLFARYSAEQIGIAVNIQSQEYLHSKTLPSPIDNAVLTKDTIPLVAAALIGTSIVTQPRTHLVWDALCSYISESKSAASSQVDIRIMRKVCPLSNESVDDLLGAVLQKVLSEILLGIDLTGEKGKASTKTTHERRALALCIVRNLSSVEYMSSLTGRTRIILEPEILENLVFCRTLIEKLFLDVVCAGTGRQKKQAEHLLKPLALKVLMSISQTLSAPDGSDETSPRDLDMGFSVAKSLLLAEPRFDSRTKTSTVQTLLGLVGDEATTEATTAFWESYEIFLEERIVQSVVATSFGTLGYLDLLFQLGKRLVRGSPGINASTSDAIESVTRRIIAFLMAVAFFDCGDVVDAKEPNQKGAKRSKTNDRVRGETLNPIHAAAVLVRNFGNAIPFEVRSTASSRFFSLVSGIVISTVHSPAAEKETRIVNFLSRLREMQDEFLQAGAKRISLANHQDDDGMDVEDSPDSIVEQLLKSVEDNDGSNTDMILRARVRLSRSCAMLGLSLHLLLLNCGRPDDFDGNDEPDSGNEDYEEITCTLSDVRHVALLFLNCGSTENGQNPLLALAELCTNVLSSVFGVGNRNQSRGASPTFLREIVKQTWIGGLSLCAADIDGSGESPLDCPVVDLLLNAVGAIDGSHDVVAADSELEKGEDSDSESSEDISGAEVFNEVKGAPEILHEEADEIKPGAGKGSVGDEDGESELELDSQNLQAMLENDDISDVGINDLEHHAGADAALAKLIQLKQDARKAGQLALERSEIARQMCCLVLMETLVVGKVGTWGCLLRVDMLLRIILPLLRYRMELVRALEKSGGGKGSGEKRALLDRLTALLKAKVLKAKVPASRWSLSNDVSESTRVFGSKLLDLARKSNDKEHQTLCNASLVFMLRNLDDIDSIIEGGKIYVEALEEWSTKRTTKIGVAFFEGFIHQYPVAAQACLGRALASAACKARSSFLKSESLRLLALLYNPKLNPDEEEFEKKALSIFIESVVPVLGAVSSSLEDHEMKKTKRVREVLRALEKVLNFLLTTKATARVAECLNDLKCRLQKLKDATESQGTRKTTEKLLSDINEILMKWAVKKSKQHSLQADNGGNQVFPSSPRQAKTEQAKRKKKQKSKKRKKR